MRECCPNLSYNDNLLHQWALQCYFLHMSWLHVFACLHSLANSEPQEYQVVTRNVKRKQYMHRALFPISDILNWSQFHVETFCQESFQWAGSVPIFDRVNLEERGTTGTVRLLACFQDNCVLGTAIEDQCPSTLPSTTPTTFRSNPPQVTGIKPTVHINGFLCRNWILVDHTQIAILTIGAFILAGTCVVLHTIIMSQNVFSVRLNYGR